MWKLKIISHGFLRGPMEMIQSPVWIIKALSLYIWVVVKIIVPFLGPYCNTAPNI